MTTFLSERQKHIWKHNDVIKVKYHHFTTGTQSDFSAAILINNIERRLGTVRIYRKRPCISRTFFQKIEAKTRGCGLSMDTSMFGVLKNLLNIHKTSKGAEKET